jgi:hypothetical protein
VGNSARRRAAPRRTAPLAGGKIFKEKTLRPDLKPLTKFQAIWAQAKANGAVQDLDSLPANNWQWPTGTFLQRRLAELRERELEQKH